MSRAEGLDSLCSRRCRLTPGRLLRRERHRRLHVGHTIANDGSRDKGCELSFDTMPGSSEAGFGPARARGLTARARGAPLADRFPGQLWRRSWVLRHRDTDSSPAGKPSRWPLAFAGHPCDRMRLMWTKPVGRGASSLYGGPADVRSLGEHPRSLAAIGESHFIGRWARPMR